VRAAGAVAAVLLVAAVACAQTRLSLLPELSLGAGYDDNLFLDPALAGAALQPRGDAIFDVHPSLLARATRRGHTLALDADYLERLTPSNGDLRDLLLRLAWSSPVWRRVRLSVGGLYEHYEASQYADNTFDLGGGEASLRLVLAAAWVQAGYRFDARAYPDPLRNGQLDLEHWATATAHVRLHRRLSLDGGYRFLSVGSSAPMAALARHRADVALSLQPASWLSVSASYAFWWQHLPNGAPPPTPTTLGGPRSDLAHAIGAVVIARPLRWLELFARYDLLVSTSDASNGRYQRNQVLAGVAVFWELARERLPATPLLPTVEGHEVTFRARARPGAAVAVIGDWNGWQPAALAPAGGDRFEGRYTLPPGRHAFAISIDGVAVTPTDAIGYVDDGFGGKNGLVEVP
jgi:hypothetical protein